MGDTWIADMTHFLDETGAIPDLPGARVGLRDHLGAIVAFVTSWSSTEEGRSPVRCRRRPRRRPCRGWIRANLDPESGEIVWICPICEDRGVIRGWEDSPWDLTYLKAGPRDGPFTRGSIGTRAPRAIEASPHFTPAADKMWAAVDPSMRIRLLNNVWCTTCRGSSSMELLEGRVEQGDLVLRGRCVACGNDVARVVEGR